MKTHTYTMRPLSALIPYARNARTHSDAQVAQLASSIREFGFTSPVVIDEDGGILAGHGRVMALRKLGVEEVPCIEASGLSEAQRRAYVLADNKLALNAGWDEEMLKIELQDLQGLGVDMDLLGWSPDELTGLFEEPVGDPPNPPEPEGDSEKYPCSVGDVFKIGDQVIACWDSSDFDSVTRLVVNHLQEGCGAVVFDPEFDADFSRWDIARIGASDVFVFGDCMNRTFEGCEIPGNWVFQFVWDGVTRWVVRGKPLMAHKTCDWYSSAPEYNPDGAFDPREGAIAPQTIKNARGVANLPGSPDGKRLASVFRAPVTDESHGPAKHGKPVIWLAMIIANCSRGGVVDLFAGTGAVACACARIGRQSVSIEIDPERVAYAVSRVVNESGAEAVKVGNLNEGL